MGDSEKDPQIILWLKYTNQMRYLIALTEATLGTYQKTNISSIFEEKKTKDFGISRDWLIGAEGRIAVLLGGQWRQLALRTMSKEQSYMLQTSFKGSTARPCKMKIN